MIRGVLDEGRAHGVMLAQAHLTVTLLNAITRASESKGEAAAADSLLQQLGRQLAETDSQEGG